MAVWLVLCFLAQEAAFAAPELAGWLARPGAAARLSIELPRSVATVEETHDAGPGSPVIYLVQDAHANESAQRSIAEVIRRLSAEKSARVVFLEGGTGDDSLSYLRRYGTAAQRRRIAESYLKRGYLQGADYLDLVSDEPIRLWGVEDKELYFASLRRYRRLVEARPRLETLVESMNRAIRTLKPRTYGPFLASLDRSREEFFANRLALTDYLSFLQTQARQHGVDLERYRQIRAFEGLKQAEAGIDFEQASREQLELVRALPAERQARLARAAAASRHEPSRLGADDPKHEDAFYAILEEAAGDLKRYPQLSAYVAYLREASALDAASLVREKDDLEARLMDRAASGERERRLLAIARSTELLGRLFALRLSREDFRRVETSLESFDLVAMTGTLNRALFDAGDHHEDVVFLQPEYDGAFAAAKEFYELTEARDRTFLERIDRKMRGERHAGAVLVAGGYHSTSLKDLLARAGYSYVSILPRVAEETNQPKYEQLLLGQLGSASALGAADGHIGIVVGREFVLPAAKPNRARPRLVHVLQKELGATPSARAGQADLPRAPERPSGAPAGARLAADPIVRALSRDWKRAAAAFEASNRGVAQLIRGLIRAHDRTPFGMYYLRGQLAGAIRPVESEFNRTGTATDGAILRARDELVRIGGWRLQDKFKKPILAQQNRAEALLAKRLQVWAILDTTDATASQRRDAFTLADAETRASWLRLSAVGALSALDTAIHGLPRSGRLRERADELRGGLAAWLGSAQKDSAKGQQTTAALAALSVNEGVWPETRQHLAEAARHLGRAVEIAEVIEEANRPRYLVEDSGQMAFDFDSGARLAGAEQVQALRQFLRGQVRDFDRKAQRAGLSDDRLAILLDADDPGERELNALFKTFNLNRGQRQSILAWARRQREAARLQAAGPVFDGEAWVAARLRPVVESLWARAGEGVERSDVLAALEPLAKELDPQARLDPAADPRPVYGRDDVYGLVVKTITPRLLERGTYFGRPVSAKAADLIRDGRPPLLTARVVGIRKVSTPDGHEAVIYRIHDPSTPERPGLFGAAQAAQDRFILEPVDTVRGAGVVATVAKQLEDFIPAFQEIRRLIGPDLSASPVTPPFLNHALHRTGFYFLSGLSTPQAFEQLFWAVAGAEEVNHFDAFRFAFERLEARGIDRRTVEADIPTVARELLRDDRPGNAFRDLLDRTQADKRPVVALAVIELEARLKALSLDDPAFNPYPAYTLMTYGGAQHGVYALVSHLIAQALAPEFGVPPTLAAFEQVLLTGIAQDPPAHNARLRANAKAAYARYFWTTQERKQLLSSPASGARLAARERPAGAAVPGVDWIEEVRSMATGQGARLSKTPAGPLDPRWLRDQLVQEQTYLDAVLGMFHAEVLAALEASGQPLDAETAGLARRSVTLYYLRAYFLSLSTHPREDINVLSAAPGAAEELEQAIRYFQRSHDPYARRLDHPDVFRMILDAEGADRSKLPQVLGYFRRAAAHFNNYLSSVGDYHYEDLGRQYQRAPHQLRRLIQKLFRRQQQAGLIYQPAKFYRGFRHRNLSAQRPRSVTDRLPADLDRPVLIHNASFASGATINHPHQQMLFLEKDFLAERMAGVERAMWDYSKKIHWYEDEGGVRFGEFFGWPGTVAVIEAADYWAAGTDRASARARLTSKVHEVKESFLARGLTFNAYLSLSPDLSPRYLIFPRRKSELARKPIPDRFKDSWSAQAMAGMYAARDADEYRRLTARDILRGFETENPGRVHRILGLPAPVSAEVVRPLGESALAAYFDVFLVPARSMKTQPKALSTAKPPGSFLYYYWPVGEKGMRLGGGFSLVPNVRPFTPEHWVIITDGTGVQEITPEAIANSLEVWHDILAPAAAPPAGARLAADDSVLMDLVAQFTPDGRTPSPDEAAVERAAPRAPPDGSVRPSRGIHVDWTDTLSGARLSETFRNFSPEESPVPERIDGLAVSTAIFVMLPTAGGNKKAGEIDMLSIWMGRLFEEIERIDDEAERRGERYHVEVVIGENSAAKDKPEVFEILRELMGRYGLETRSGRGLRMTVLNLPPGTGKSGTVNELHREARRRYEAENRRRSERGAPPLKMYLHLMDDDSYLADRKDAEGNERSQILSNLDLLRDEERSRAMVREIWGEEGRLKAVGTTPVRPLIVMEPAPAFGWFDYLLARPLWSYLARGWRYAFQHVSNIRKENHGVPLAQIYGQSYTMDIDDYPEGGIPIDTGVDDCFLSIWLKHIVTNPDAEHEHAEPATLGVFVRRYWRDRAHGRALDELARESGQEELAREFQRVRKASHDRWTERFLERHSWASPARWLNAINYVLKRILDWLYDRGWAPKQYYDLRFGFVRGTNIGNVRLVGTRVGSERGFHIVTPQGVITMPSALLWTTLEVMGLDVNLNARLTYAEVEGRLLEDLGELPASDREGLRAILTQVWLAAGRQPQEEITVREFAHALNDHRELEQSASWRYLGDYLRRRKIVLLFDMIHNSDNWLVSRAAMARLDTFIREEAHEDELNYLTTLSRHSQRPLLPQLAASILDRARELPGTFDVGERKLLITGKRGQRVWVAVEPSSGRTLALTQADSAEDRRLNRWSRLVGEDVFAPSEAYDSALGVRVTPMLGRQGEGFATMGFHQYASRPHTLTEWTAIVTRVARIVAKLHEAGDAYGEVRRLNALVDANLADPSDVRVHVTGAGAYEWSDHLAPEADLFGLGSLLYFGFAYRDPFLHALPGGETYLPLTSAPVELNRIIQKALGKTSERYASAAELAEDLEAFERQLRSPDQAASPVFEGAPADRAIADVRSSLGLQDLPSDLGLEWSNGDFVLRHPEALPEWTPAQLRALLTYQHHRPGQRWQYVRLGTLLLTESLRRRPALFEAVWRQARDGGQVLQPLVAREVLNAAMAVQRADPERRLEVGNERLRVESSVGLDTYRVIDQAGEPWILKITDERERAHTTAAAPQLVHPRMPHEPLLGGLLVRYVPGGLLDGLEAGRLEQFEAIVGRFAAAARKLAAVRERGVAHRDALAHNFRVEDDGQTVTPIDFGLSEALPEGEAAPHVERSDVMLLAAALEQALSGQPRWMPLSHGFARPNGGPGERPNPTLPPFLSEVIRGGINRDFSMERFADELTGVHRQLTEPRYTSPFDGRSMQQQLQAVHDLSLDEMSETVRRPSAGARLATGQPTSAKDWLVLGWLSEPAQRPDPLEMERAIREEGLTEWDILRAARKAGLAEPLMHQTYTELDSLTPYLLAVAKEALEAYGDHRMLLLGRDAENVYDVLRVLSAAAGRADLVRLFPGSMDFWRLPKPFARVESDQERALKIRFFESFGLSRDSMESGGKFLILDAGFAGSVAEEIRSALAGLLGWDADDPRLGRSLVPRLVSSPNKLLQMVRFDAAGAAPGRLAADFPKSSLVYPVSDADSFDFLIGTALQLLPRWHGVYESLEETEDGIRARPSTLAPLREDLDDPASPNDSIVNPLAALLVQHRLVARLVSDLDSGRVRVRGEASGLRLETPDLPVAPRMSAGARLSAGKTVLVYDEDEIRTLLESRADKLQMLLRIHDKLYGPMRETARQILSVTPAREREEELLRGVLAQLFVAVAENAIDAYLEQRATGTDPGAPLRIEVEVFHPDGDGRVTVRLSANGTPYRPGERKTQLKRDGTLPALGGRGEGLLNVDKRIRILDPRSRWRLADRRELVGDVDGSVFEWSFRAGRIDGILSRARRHDLGGILSGDGGYARLLDEGRRLIGHLRPEAEAGWPALLRAALDRLFLDQPRVVFGPLDPEAVAVVHRTYWQPLFEALRRTRFEDPAAWRVFGPDAERLAVAIAAENDFTWQFWETRLHAAAAFEAVAGVHESLRHGRFEDASTRAYYRRQLDFFRTLGERAFSIVDWDGAAVASWTAAVRGVLRHDEAVRLLTAQARSDLRVAERHLSRLNSLSGARLSARLDPGRLDAYEAIERLLAAEAVDFRVNPDSTIYAPSPLPAVMSALGELRAALGGDLSGKRLLDLGAGDLRVSLVAAALFGMKVTAVEKDPYLAARARVVLARAREEGLVRSGDVNLIGGEDALTLPWGDVDAAVFFYTEPGDELDALRFRLMLEEKWIRQAKPGAVFAMMFTGGQIEYGLERFERLTTAWPQPAPIYPSLDGIYLQLYGAGARLAGEEEWGGLAPYNPYWEAQVNAQKEFSSRSDEIAREFRSAVGPDADRVRRIVYPGAHYDAPAAVALLRVMPLVRDIHFISHYEVYPTPETRALHQQRLESNLRRLAEDLGIDASRVRVRVTDGSYYDLEAPPGPDVEEGLTAVIDKYPGRNSSMRLDPRYRASILRDTRPGDLVISRVDHLVPPLEWASPPLATGLTLPYLYDHQNRWSVQRIEDADDSPGASAGARLAARQAAERLFEFVDAEVSGKSADDLRVDPEAFEDVNRNLRKLRQAVELYLGRGEHADDLEGLTAVAESAEEGIALASEGPLETPYEWIVARELTQDLAERLRAAASYGDSAGARLASAPETRILEPMRPREAVRMVEGAIRYRPIRDQVHERMLAIRELKPGQRSLHVGNGASLLPVLEGLMGLHVFATDTDTSSPEFVRHFIEATGLDTLIRATGGTFLTDRLDLRSASDYRPGVLFDHVVAIDVLSGMDGIGPHKRWIPETVRLAMDQLVEKLAPGATVLISGAGVVTHYDGAEYLMRSLERRGIPHESVDVTGLLPSGAADTRLWLIQLLPPRTAPPAGARLSVSDFTQRGGRLNEVHRRLRDEQLVPYLTASGVDPEDAATVANTLVRARPGLLDYYRQTNLLTDEEAALLAEIAENRSLESGQPLLDRLERLSLRDPSLGRRVRERIAEHAAVPAAQRRTLVERLVPASQIRDWVASGVPEWVVFAALRTRFHLVRQFDEARRFVEDRQESTGGPAIAWQFLLFYGLEEGEGVFDEAAAWVRANQGVMGGSVNAWKFLLAHNLESADRILNRSRAWVRRHQAGVGGPANAWQIVISYGLKGAGPFVKKAAKWVAAHQSLVGGPANAWRIVTRQGLSGAAAFVSAGRAWVDANQAGVGGTQNAWRIIAAQGLAGADPFVTAARSWVLANQADVGGERNAWDIVIKQGVDRASDWVALRRPAAETDIAAGVSAAKAWFTQVTSAAPAGARLAQDDPLSRLGFEHGFSRRLELARQLGLDTRPIEAGLLDAVYVGHDLAVKQVVNPADKPLTVVYGASGVDLSNLLLSTNAQTVYLVDQVAASSAELRRQLRPLRPVSTFGAIEYLEQKFKHGHAVTDVDGVHDPARSLAVELASIGVGARDVSTVRDAGERTTEIRFKWAYAGQAPKDRRVYLVQADITDPDTYPEPLRRALREGIDAYYQRAGMAVATRYDRFAWDIGAAVRPGGFFVTDDFTYRSGTYGLVDLTPRLRGLGYQTGPELAPERLRQYGYAVLDARRNVLRTHQLSPPYEPHYGFDVFIRQRSAGARLSTGKVEIHYDDELLAELLSVAHRKSEVLITIHSTLFAPLLPVAAGLLDLSGASTPGQVDTLRAFLTQLLLPVVENAVDAYLERRATDPSYRTPLYVEIEALRFDEGRVGIRVTANGIPYVAGERKTEVKRTGPTPALGGLGIGLLEVQKKTILADSQSARWTLRDRRALLGDEDGSVFEWSFDTARTDALLRNVLFYGTGARLSMASELRRIDSTLARAEVLARRAAIRAAQPPDEDGVESQRLLAQRARRRLGEAARAIERLGLPELGSVRRREVEAAILEGHAFLRRGNLKSASGDPDAIEDYERAFDAYEVGIQTDDGSRKGRLVADASFVQKAIAIHHFKEAAAAVARGRRTGDAGALREAVDLYERARREFKGSMWMTQSARREYVKDGVSTRDLDESNASMEHSIDRIDRRLESLRRAAGERPAAGARLAAFLRGPWHERRTTERIDHELVRENLIEIRRGLQLINSGLEFDQRIEPDDLSDQAIEQYGHAAAHLNHFLDRAQHTPERLERAYRAFHYALARRGLIRKPGIYETYDHHAEEVRRLFRWLFTDAAQRRIEDDPVAVAAHVFVTLVNLQPFNDGNKRTASLIANFILIKGGYQPFVLSESNAGRWAAVVYPADDQIEISEREFRDFLDDEVLPARGARLSGARSGAAEIRLFARDHAAALEAFALELWRAQSAKLGEPFALETAPGSPAVWTLEADADAGSLALRAEGLAAPVLLIADARSRLAELRARPKERTDALTAQGAVAMLRLARMKAQMHFAEEPRSSVPLAFEIPAGLLDGIRDPQELEAQARMLVSQVAELSADARTRSNVYYLSGVGEDDRGLALRRVVESAGPSSPLRIGPPADFRGLTVRLVDSAAPPSVEREGTIYLPVSGIRPGALLGWNQALVAGTAAGAFYANYFDAKTNSIDFDLVRADEMPERLFGFYSLHAKNRLPDRGTLLGLFSGRASASDFAAYGFNLPVVERIPVNLLLAAARQMYRAVSAAA